MLKIISFSPTITKHIGAGIAERIAKNKNLKNGPIFILLEGNLGAGKTTFTMGFLKYFGITTKSASPTFTIMKHYRPMQKSKVKSQTYNAKVKSETKLISDMYHIDAYRLKSKADLEVIGFNEIKKQPYTVVLMEWPVNIKGIRLRNVVKIKLEYGEKINERVITI